MVVDEAELGVERGVLGEVPTRLVRLGAPDLPGLVDPLEDADHRLLVELRALCEERRPAEVVEPEDIRAALGRGADDLRRRDLREAERVERAAKAGDRSRQNLELRPLARMAPCERRVIQQHGQGLLQLGSPQLERRRLGRLGEDAERRLAQLDAARRLLRLDGDAIDLDHGLRAQLQGQVDHDLGQARTVSEHDERDGAELTLGMQPAGQRHALARMGGKLVERTLIRITSSTQSPYLCGRRRPRGATALRRLRRPRYDPVTGVGRTARRRQSASSPSRAGYTEVRRSLPAG